MGGGREWWPLGVTGGSWDQVAAGSDSWQVRVPAFKLDLQVAAGSCRWQVSIGSQAGRWPVGGKGGSWG